MRISTVTIGGQVVHPSSTLASTSSRPSVMAVPEPCQVSVSCPGAAALGRNRLAGSGLVIVLLLGGLLALGLVLARRRPCA